MKFIKRIKTWYYWYKNKDKLNDLSISLLDRAVIASKLINECNKINISLTQAQYYYIDSPLHSMPYMVSELNRIVTELTDSNSITISLTISKVEKIRLDKFITTSVELYNPRYSLYEGYLDCSRLVNELITTQSNIKKTSQLNIPNTYIERRAQYALETYILVTQVLLELYYNKK